ncbi:MAG TPA: hypothetical protein VGH28_18670 [Polyangiaceae bacterium]
MLTTVLAGSLLLPALSRADGPTRIQVHVDSSLSVTVQQHVNGDWIDRCDSPCDRELPADGEYRIGGDGVRPSRTFALEHDTRHVDLAVHAGTAAQRSGGIALAVLGGVASVTGAFLLVIGSVEYSIPNSYVFAFAGTNVGPDRDLMTAGGITLGAGALAATAKTTVEQQAKPMTAALADADAAPRAPTWREPAAGPREIGRPMLVPLFAGRF